jgi:1-acyl-sn-glycerol-3-phosphate acyltransferase
MFIYLKCDRFSEGEENVPESGAAIIIAPHLGSIDAVLAPELVTRRGRMPRILAKKSLWNIPIVKQAFNSGRLIQVDRSGTAQDSLEEARIALKNGDTVFIFPEGTYSKDPDSWPMTCKTGAARLALISGAPVVPILQDGEQFLLKKNANRTELPWFKRYHSGNRVLVHLKAYPAIDFSDIFSGQVSSPDSEIIRKVNERIEDTLTRIVEESRGVNAPKRWDDRLKKRAERGVNG